MKRNQKGIVFLPILIIVVLLGIIGYFVYQNYQLKQTQVSPTQIVPTPQEERDAENWNTYNNNKYGYLINFPNDWTYNRGPGNVGDDELSEQRSILIFGPSSIPPGVSFSIETNEFHQRGLSRNCDDLSDCTQKSLDALSSYSNNILEPTNISFLGEEAKTVFFVRTTDSYSQSWYITFVIIDGNYFRFSAYSDTSSFESNKIIFDQILSTFKFIESSTDVNTPPTGWKAHKYSSESLTIYTPDDWDSNIEEFQEIPSTLISFWKEVSPNIVPIMLDIKTNWDNTGNAQHLPRTYTVAGNIPAARNDPPTKDEREQVRYETVIYFERLGKVYVFQCTHNWVRDYVDTCNKMVKTMSFE